MRRASLAAVVVLPEPCRPAIMITVGGLVAVLSPTTSPPPSMSDQAIVDDLHHLIGGADRADHRFAGGARRGPWR